MRKSKNNTSIGLGKKLIATMLTLAMGYTTVGTALSAAAIAPVEDDHKLGAFAGKYYSQFSSNEEVLAATAEKNVEVAMEGAILLKNGGGENGDQDKLPYRDMKYVSLFGINSDAYGYGGTGSGSGMLEQGADIYTSFETEGIKINPRLKELYQKYSGGSLSDTSGYLTPTYEDKELSLDYYTPTIQGTYARYNDAAIVVIGRLGGEGADLAVENVDDHVRPNENGELVDFDNEHYLELTYREEQLIEHVKANFDKVIVLLNSGNVIEMGELENDPEIDAVMNIVQTGDYGFNGILKLLKGEGNPSGRTTDIYTADFTLDPVYQNFGNGAQTVESGNNYALNYKGAPAEDGTEASTVSLGTNTVEYEEGIYLGYKYYETMYAEIKAGNVDLTAEATKAVLGSEDLGDTYVDADDWYDRNVIYPFGYGLSYTEFKWNFDSLEMDTPVVGYDSKFTATVTVQNVGDVAGKDVVELYMSAPYTAGGIEKAATQLLGFAKTPMLQPGEKATVEVKFDAYDIAAYDWSDANDNGFAGWEIEAGEYKFTANKNSHEVVATETLTLDAFKLEVAQATGNKVANRFVDSPNPEAKFNYTAISPTMTIMTRANMIETFPVAPTAEERLYEAGDKYNPIVDTLNAEVTGNLKFTEEEVYTKVNYGYVFGGDYDGSAELWMENVKIPETWTQAADANGEVAVRLPDLMGLSPYSDAIVESDNEFINGLTEAKAWEVFLNQLTYEELKLLIHTGYFKTAPIARVGKEEAVDPDGPCTIGGQTKNGYSSARGGSGTRYWCSAQMQAATWNVELCREIGDLIGEEALWNNYNGWYAPSMNIHRSPLSGRNFEYYSQDAVHGGIIAAAIISSVSAHGVYPYIKHFALNDQETSRNNIATWADEQTMRENYLRNFQYAVEQGNSCGIMTGFNRIGAIDCPENYALMTQILRQEWGFDGSVVTDYEVGTVGAAHNNMEVFHYAGTNIPLSDKGTSARGQGTWDATLRNGMGGPKVGKVSVTTGTDSSGNPTVELTYSTTEFVTTGSAVELAYYYTRTRAMDLLYTHCRSNAMDNGADFQKNLTNTTLRLPAGYNNLYSARVATVTGFAADAPVTYAFKSGELPAGVAFDAENGAFTSRNAAVGSANVTVTAFYEGWASKDFTVKLELVDFVNFDKDITNIPTGEEISIQVTNNFFVADPDLGAEEEGIVSVAINRFNSLPNGLTGDTATGVITGTPTRAGNSSVRIRFAVVTRTRQANGTFRDSSTNYEVTVQFVVGRSVRVTVDGVAQNVEVGKVMEAPVAPEAPAGMVFDGWYANGSKVDFSKPVTEEMEIVSRFVTPDTIEFRVENGKIQASINGGEWVDVANVEDLKGADGKDGVDGKDGQDGKDGVDGVNGQDGKDGKDGKDGANAELTLDALMAAAGCTSVIGSGLAAIALVSAAAFVLRKKEN